MRNVHVIAVTLQPNILQVGHTGGGHAGGFVKVVHGALHMFMTLQRDNISGKHGGYGYMQVICTVDFFFFFLLNYSSDCQIFFIVRLCRLSAQCVIFIGLACWITLNTLVLC